MKGSNKRKVMVYAKISSLFCNDAFTVTVKRRLGVCLLTSYSSGARPQASSQAGIV